MCVFPDQVNPSVTLSLLAARRIDVLRALFYVAAQCVGAFLASGIFYLALPLKANAKYLVNKVCSQHFTLLEKVIEIKSFLNYFPVPHSFVTWLRCL